MTNINSEGGLGIGIKIEKWIPVYFNSEKEAKCAINRYCQDGTRVYFTNNEKAVYYEADKGRFVIFVQTKKNERKEWTNEN